MLAIILVLKAWGAYPIARMVSLFVKTVRLVNLNEFVVNKSI